MANTSMLHVRIDDDLKRQATTTLDAIGLSTSDAVRMLFKRVVAEQRIPFEMKVPNAETRAAMAEADAIAAAHAKRWADDDEGSASRDPENQQ